jgi:hypothetical protein
VVVALAHMPIVESVAPAWYPEQSTLAAADPVIV